MSALVERLEDVWQVVGVYALPVVADGEQQLLSLLAGAEGDGAPPRPCI